MFLLKNCFEYEILRECITKITFLNICFVPFVGGLVTISLKMIDKAMHGFQSNKTTKSDSITQVHSLHSIVVKMFSRGNVKWWLLRKLPGIVAFLLV